MRRKRIYEYTDERQAKLDDLERINKELRQSERRRERMRLEEDK